MDQTDSPGVGKVPRPDHVEDVHLVYLDALKATNVTNMLGAVPYLELEFGVTRRKGREILTYWMRSYEERHGPNDTEDDPQREALTPERGWFTIGR